MEELKYNLLLLKRRLLIANCDYASKHLGRNDKLQNELIETTSQILKMENRLN